MLTFATPKAAPHLIPTGAPPTFAADVSDSVDWLQKGRSFRRAATQSALIALTGMEDRDLGIVDTVPGASFVYDGTVGAWRLSGVPTFPDPGARDAALSTPAQGMRAFIVSLGCETAYFTVYNASTNPGGTLLAGWYPIAGLMPVLEMSDAASASMTSTKQIVTVWGTTVKRRTLPALVAGVFTCDLPGRYFVSTTINIAVGSAVAGYVGINKNGTGTIAANTDGASSSIGNYLSVATEVDLALGDTLGVYVARTSGGITDRRFIVRYVGPS